MLCAIAFVLPVIGVMNVTDRELGTRNIWTAAMFAGSMLMPAAAILSFLFTIDAWRSDAGRWLRSYAMLVSIAALIISGYLSAWGMIGSGRGTSDRTAILRRREPDDQPDERTGQDDLPEIRTANGDEVGEERADQQADGHDRCRRLRLSSHQADDQVPQRRL